MTAFSGVRSSWDMLARNSDLCRLATSSSADLVSSSRNSRALTIATEDWDAKVSQEVHHLLGEGPHRPPTDDQHPHDHAPAHHRDREHRSPAVAVQDLEVRVRVVLGQVADLQRAPLGRRPPDQGRVPADRDGAQLGDQRLARAVGGAHQERVGRLVVLHDRATVGAGQPHGVGHDPAEHLVGVEARADGLAQLAQCLELLDLAGQLGAPRLERAHQVHLPQRDGGLGREVVQQARVPLAEGRDRPPPHGEDAHDLVPSSIGAASRVRNPARRWRSCRPYS